MGLLPVAIFLVFYVITDLELLYHFSNPTLSLIHALTARYADKLVGCSSPEVVLSISNAIANANHSSPMYRDGQS